MREGDGGSFLFSVHPPHSHTYYTPPLVVHMHQNITDTTRFRRIEVTFNQLILLHYLIRTQQIIKNFAFNNSVSRMCVYNTHILL